jgi:uncharacterized protein (TIGR02266 family)
MTVLDNILKVGMLSGAAIFALLVMWFGAVYIRGRRRSRGTSPEPIKLKKTGGEERREYPRADLRWPVNVVTPEGALKAETRNISVGGAFICCEAPFSTGKVFPLSIEIPEGKPLEATAEVVWNNMSVPDDRVVNRGMGIRFVQISLEDRQLIHKAVQAHLGEN